MSYLQQIRQADNELASQRRKRVPRQRSLIHDGLRAIRTVARTTRFLEPDSTTRTLVSWSHAPETLPDPGVVVAHVVHYDSTYRAQRRVERRYTSSSDRETSIGQVRALPVRGIDGRHHLGLQWDAYPQDSLTSDGRLAHSERTHTSVARFDTLEALPTDPSRLVMSDLLPGKRRTSDVPDDTMGIGPQGESFMPYPFTQIQADQFLALYFEVYNLAYGADDRTHYTVTYEMEQKKAVQRTFRQTGEQTATTIESEGTSRRSGEIIELDLSEAIGTEAVRVTVRVTDQVSGRTAERSLTFGVVE